MANDSRTPDKIPVLLSYAWKGYIKKKVQSKHSNHGDGDNRLDIALLKLGSNETDPHRLLFV